MSATDLPPGHRVGDYTILRKIGQGGMGELYLARAGDATVVVKRCLGPVDEAARRALDREARFLAGLSHPRLPTVRGVAVDGSGSVFLVMDFIPGTTLEEWVDGQKARGPGWERDPDYVRRVGELALELADVLDFLHTRPDPVVHHDLKPPNLMVRPESGLALIDFGVARYARAAGAAPRRGATVIGYTAGYVAPEYVHARVSHPRCDIHSFGVVLHFLLTGTGPDLSDTADDVQHLPRIPPCGDRVRDALADVSWKARQPDPGARHPTALDLSRELAAATGVAPPPACPACGRPAPAVHLFCACGAPLRDAPADAPAVVVAPGDADGPTEDQILRAVDGAAPAHLDRYRALQQLLELNRDPGFDQLVCLDELRARGLEPFPHQIEAARAALAKMGGYCLLADEVGLGKTIEAGIVFKELAARGLARRVLVVTPDWMCAQWKEEMRQRFGEFFLVFGDDVDTTLAWRFDRVIAPYQVAEDRTHREHILKAGFDLVVMDEAHHLLVRDPHREWKLQEFARGLGRSARFFLMLSATPLHNNLRELHTLLSLLRPGSVEDFGTFAARYIDPGKPFEPRNVADLQARLGTVMIRHTRRAIKELPFPRREAYPERVRLDETHVALFRDFREFFRRDLSRLGRVRTDDEDMQLAVRDGLEELAESFHSSPGAYAACCDTFLDRFARKLSRTGGAAGEWLRRVEDGLRRFRNALRPEHLQPKVDAVCAILERRAPLGGKFLVFTQYDDTADELYQQLGAATGLSVVRYPAADPTRRAAGHGDAARAALEEFRTTAQVMVCGRNASEGLNLQVAHSMINYDLPWDPMRLEQRIGRVQRLGQASTRVMIWNLVLAGTVEEEILATLDQKINMFTATVGEVEDILGRVGDWDGRALGFDIFLAAPGEMDARIDAALTAGQRGRRVCDRILGSVWDDGPAEPVAAPPRGPDDPPPDGTRAPLTGGRAGQGRCPRCDAPTPADADRCPQCQAWLTGEEPEAPDAAAPVGAAASGVPDMIVCPGCRAFQPPGATECAACRRPLARPDDEPESEPESGPGPAVTRCPHCDRDVVAPGDRECGFCGGALSL